MQSEIIRLDVQDYLTENLRDQLKGLNLNAEALARAYCQLGPRGFVRLVESMLDIERAWQESGLAHIHRASLETKAAKHALSLAVGRMNGAQLKRGAV